MKIPKGERLNIRFNRKIKLESHGARLTSDGGLLAYTEFDNVLGLFNSAPDIINDRQIGRNIKHDMNTCCSSLYTVVLQDMKALRMLSVCQ